MENTAEHQRLLAHRERCANWRNWGPYLSERAWGTVREDYSAHGDAWSSFSHDHARSRVYRWNEDGLAGISDRNQWLCFALALWNDRDPILKERLFGLTGPEGNHGEDVKEVYFYLDNTPTHSYMKMLYKYPQAAFPYAELVAANGRRGVHDSEYELIDTGVFAENRYFDVFVEYAKAGEDDILICITTHNRGPDAANLIMPLVFFVSPHDPMMLRTLNAINRPPHQGGLVADSLVFRYNVTSGIDGLVGDEGTFNMCTFWLVEALTRASRLEEARHIFEKMLGYASHLVLYAVAPLNPVCADKAYRRPGCDEHHE